jgi:hypothetical protein
MICCGKRLEIAVNARGNEQEEKGKKNKNKNQIGSK